MAVQSVYVYRSECPPFPPQLLPSAQSCNACNVCTTAAVEHWLNHECSLWRLNRLWVLSYRQNITYSSEGLALWPLPALPFGSVAGWTYTTIFDISGQHTTHHISSHIIKQLTRFTPYLCRGNAWADSRVRQRCLFSRWRTKFIIIMITLLWIIRHLFRWHYRWQ